MSISPRKQLEGFYYQLPGSLLPMEIVEYIGCGHFSGEPTDFGRRLSEIRTKCQGKKQAHLVVVAGSAG